MLALSAVSLSKTYRSTFPRREEVPALSDVSLDVEQGQVFSLLGPNGAGKTTFIKILLSLVHPSAGTAQLLGIPVPSPLSRVRIGYLPENHRYPPYLTGEQVLRFFGRLGGVSSTDLNTRIPSLLHLVGMETWKAMKIRKYSKGMLQRIGIAQSLVNDPEVLFLDEPTDGVDPVGRTEIREVIRSLKHQGKTIFLNSHLLSEVELISDRVAILDKGRLLRSGTVDDLTESGSDYVIGIGAALPDTLRDEASARVIPLVENTDNIRVTLQSIEALNTFIDLLRSHGVPITSILRQRNTLEDSFLSLIRREGTP